LKWENGYPQAVYQHQILPEINKNGKRNAAHVSGSVW
jgi:hypothetical protein